MSTTRVPGLRTVWTALWVAAALMAALPARARADEGNTTPQPTPLPQTWFAPDTGLFKAGYLDAKVGDLGIRGINLTGFRRSVQWKRSEPGLFGLPVVKTFNEDPGEGAVPLDQTWGWGAQAMQLGGDFDAGTGSKLKADGAVLGGQLTNLWTLYSQRADAERAGDTDALGLARMRGSELAAFFRMGPSFTFFSMDGNNFELDVFQTAISFTGGLQGSVPLFWAARVEPFAEVGATMQMITTTSETTVLGKKISSSDFTSVFSPLYSYGFDMILTPLRSNPRWELSLGFLGTVASGNRDGATTILFGLQYNWGRHWDDLQIGTFR